MTPQPLMDNYISIRKNVIRPLYKKYKLAKNYESVDFLVVSYQKSGRTWVRFLLAKYFELTYGIDFTLELSTILHDQVPKIAFTHHFDDLEYFKNKSIVMLTRDPRDIIVSHYHHCHNRELKFKGSLSKYIRSKHFSINNVIEFLNMQKRYASKYKNTFWMTYEALHENCFDVMSKLLKYFDIPVNKNNLRKAIKLSSFKNMQHQEKHSSSSHPRFGNPMSKDKNAFKVRKGKVGNYKHEILPRDLNYINQEIQSNLKIKDYLT